MQSSAVTSIYRNNAKGKCVKRNGALAVSAFSLEAQRIKEDGERQPGSNNRQPLRMSEDSPYGLFMCAVPVVSHRHSARHPYAFVLACSVI